MHLKRKNKNNLFDHFLLQLEINYFQVLIKRGICQKHKIISMINMHRIYLKKLLRLNRNLNNII
jgi:hypothetical protein